MDNIELQSRLAALEHLVQAALGLALARCSEAVSEEIKQSLANPQARLDHGSGPVEVEFLEAYQGVVGNEIKKLLAGVTVREQTIRSRSS
ncbi:hypothetical protein [Dongia sedimenti]|uniref:Uncharacterized protein n=1 Tax=Dongia sedimenti TaxID=3064282 RepID=A0ABU0YWV5_9PROT|nr:hypothetical protein [Rhodospirillaceae bacterium R-7]